MPKSKKMPRASSLARMFDVIRSVSDESRERESQRRDAARIFLTELKGEPLEQIAVLTAATDSGLLTLNEFFPKLRAIVGLPEPE